MSGPRLLAITHPVHLPIDASDVEGALSPEDRAAGLEIAEIKPLEVRFGEAIDWSVTREKQEHLFAELLEPARKAGKTFAYFGVAPIPLALHLGYLLTSGPSSRVYHRYRSGETWAWKGSAAGPSGIAVEPLVLPSHGSRDRGPVVIRVSTLHRIHASDTRAVVSESLAEIDISLVNPEETALEGVEVITKVMEAFSRALREAARLFPNLTCIHLFTAVRCGIAFRLGTEIKATVHPSVVTYQYLSAGSTPRYQQAIVLGEHRPASELTSRSIARTSTLSHDTIATLHEAVIQAGVDRASLLAGLDKGVVASLPTNSKPSEQILLDLHELNELKTLSDGFRPMVILLKNAVALTRSRNLHEIFERAIAMLERP